jgi:hypothetical protein
MSFADDLVSLSQESADARERNVGDILALDFTRQLFRKIKNVLRRLAASEQSAGVFSHGPMYEDLVTLHRLGREMPQLATRKFLPGVSLRCVEDVADASPLDFVFRWPSGV